VGVDREFFLSFTGSDRPWAAWLLAELDAAGYSSISQLREFVAGGNFALDMDRAARRARRTLGVLSPHALQAPYVRQEWAHRLAADPTGEQRALVLVRVEACEPEGLLRPMVYIDLVGLDEASARTRLREELAAVVLGERSPASPARFPVADGAGVVEDAGRPRFPTALPAVWNLPYRRNPSFTGREQELAGLAGQLGRGAAAVTQALGGGGGVGKTALATEYAYRHRAEFDTVWWVRAEEPATLVGDLADLAVALRLAEPGHADQRLAVVAARRWLDGHDRWLLVLDNAAAPDTATGLDRPLARLVDLIPQVLHGQVLVTSRDASWEEHATLAELDLFTSEEAVAFLQGRSGSGEGAAATEVAALLGLLPLALEQAGAYVRETRIPLATYLDRLRQFPALTVTKGRPRDRDPADTVATTWQVSLERVRPIVGAVSLLEVCAFLGPDEIPRALFSHQIDPMPDDLAALTGDPFAIDEAVGGLRRFGLVKADEQTLTVHRLVQQVIRDHLGPASAAARCGAAVRLLATALPFGGYADPGLWPLCARLLPHALAAVAHGQRLEVEPRATADLLDSAADYLQGRARYAEARTLRERALAIFEAHLGPDHPDTATSLNNLATVLTNQGELDGARGLHQRALAIRETQLGADHPQTATSLNNLAEVLRSQGDLGGARALFERALALTEARLGTGHPDTATGLNNLANVLADQDDLDGARTLAQRAMTIREERLGADHLLTAGSLNNLAGVLYRQGDLDGARALFERALAIREERLGGDHPFTAQSRSNLANVLVDHGDLDRAQALHQDALAIFEERLGADHPDTATSLDNLADVLVGLGDLDGARPLLERVLALHQRRLGPDHPDTVLSRQRLAAVAAALDEPAQPAG
jgi:tetratricopeptide (TPR) repeat protein